jgi:hypothetical protein
MEPRLASKTATEVRDYLEGLRFPALKYDVVHAARQRGAPNDVVAFLQQIPITEFQTMEELLEAYGTGR